MADKGGKKNHRKGICVHCGLFCENLTRDHVFPRAWYTQSTPSGINKWTIPSCEKCNNDHGQNEENLLVRLGKHFSPDDDDFGKIAEKSHRATDPAFARDEKDARKRAKLKKQLRSELLYLGIDNTKNILPGFGPRSQAPDEMYIGLPLDKSALEKLAIKIVKGLAYIYDKTIIGKTHDFEVKHVAEPIPEIMEMIRLYGGGSDQGPAIRSDWAFVKDDPSSRVHNITIWGRWHIHVFVTPKKR